MKNSYYVVSALFLIRKNGRNVYEWRDLKGFSTKKEAVDYAKKESKVFYSDKRTGRYLVEKHTKECMYEDGKTVKS